MNNEPKQYNRKNNCLSKKLLNVVTYEGFVYILYVIYIYIYSIWFDTNYNFTYIFSIWVYHDSFKHILLTSFSCTCYLIVTVCNKVCDFIFAVFYR